jgi:hypothetical protein
VDLGILEMLYQYLNLLLFYLLASHNIGRSHQNLSLFLPCSPSSASQPNLNSEDIDLRHNNIYYSHLNLTISHPLLNLTLPKHPFSNPPP